MNEITKTGETLSDLKKHIDVIADNTKSKNTKLAYRSDWRTFEKWCDTKKLQSYPASINTVALYLAHLQKMRRKPSTIGRAMTSLKKYHQLQGAPNPVDERIRELLGGVRRMEGIYPSKKKPITLKILCRCLEMCSSDFMGIRNKALMLVGWTGAFRRSELAAMKVEDLEDDERGIIVTIRKSKTDQVGRGRTVGLPFVDFREELCAPRALRRWLGLSQIESGPIWRGIGHISKGMLHAPTYDAAIRGKQVSLIVKDMIQKAGFEPAGYSGHSLRAGLATSLAVAGIEERRIGDITGHRSVEVLRGYVRDGRVLVDHPILETLSNQDA
ncbi:MAG: tyrosine-type recombinase/integrase [Gammaproteobacteria bacterium]|nr:tyrosine-type recombinase/integrase [Gammaproteobacteria bacterium]